MLMAMFMRVNGLTIKLTEKELIHMPTVLITMVIGSTINNMVSEWNRGLMEPSTRVTTSTARRRAKEN